METNIYKKLFEIKKANIKLQRDTEAFNYKYATLDQIQEKLWPELETQGLLVTHRIEENKVVTEVIDIDNSKSVVSSIELSNWTKAQDKGSEITYYRRYNLVSLFDLEVEDDDGKKAMNKTKPVYATFKEDKDKILKAIKTGKTPQEIIDGLKQTKTVSIDTEKNIKALAK